MELALWKDNRYLSIVPADGSKEVCLFPDAALEELDEWYEAILLAL